MLEFSWTKGEDVGPEWHYHVGMADVEEAKAAEKRMRDFEEKMAQKQRDFEKTLQDENRKSQTRLVIPAGLIALLTSLIMNLIF